MITWAFHNALELKRYPDHTDTHAFLAMLDLTPEAKAGNTTKPLRMFCVQTLYAIEKTVLVEKRPDIGEMVAKADAENAKVPKKDRMKELSIPRGVWLAHQPDAMLLESE